VRIRSRQRTRGARKATLLVACLRRRLCADQLFLAYRVSVLLASAASVAAAEHPMEVPRGGGGRENGKEGGGEGQRANVGGGRGRMREEGAFESAAELRKRRERERSLAAETLRTHYVAVVAPAARRLVQCSGGREGRGGDGGGEGGWGAGVGGGEGLWGLRVAACGGMSDAVVALDAVADGLCVYLSLYVSVCLCMPV